MRAKTAPAPKPGRLVRQDFGSGAALYDASKFAESPALRRTLESGAAERFAASVGRACMVVLGGDGTMLRAIREYHAEGLPFLGVNFGTKGFLMNEPAWVENPGAYRELPYPLLHARIERRGRAVNTVAFNEMTVKSSGGHMVTLDLSVGGHSAVRIRGDGLILCTPAGSTGYNRSAGGPVLPHGTPSLLATPLVPFEPLGARTVVLNDTDDVSFRHEAARGQALSVFADSHTALHDYDGPVQVTVRAKRGQVRLLVPESRLVDWNRKSYAEQGLSPVRA